MQCKRFKKYNLNKKKPFYFSPLKEKCNKLYYLLKETICAVFHSHTGCLFNPMRFHEKHTEHCVVVVV